MRWLPLRRKAGTSYRPCPATPRATLETRAQHDWSIVMEKMDLCDASNAVSSMQALRTEMTGDLDDIENRIRELAQSPLASSVCGIDEMRIYCVARAALYSGLASINEV